MSTCRYSATIRQGIDSSIRSSSVSLGYVSSRTRFRRNHMNQASASSRVMAALLLGGRFTAAVARGTHHLRRYPAGWRLVSLTVVILAVVGGRSSLSRGRSTPRMPSARLTGAHEQDQSAQRAEQQRGLQPVDMPAHDRHLRPV